MVGDVYTIASLRDADAAAIGFCTAAEYGAEPAAAAATAGPHSHSSPRHGMPSNARNEGSERERDASACIRRNQASALAPM